MLVLSRKKDESITIGDNITLTVTEIRGNAVRLSIEAPREVPVHRQEVYEAIKREAREASQETLGGQKNPRGSEDDAEEAGEDNPRSDDPAPEEEA